ncbi:hypothetical protein Glove_74g148 [Diversispora epigaea]|uniref:Uncharacterized protein n=1 Tax=Diversispora epigaea TaxID=1348612 RepID=A0A397JIW1_9GLOM|nr:hypothetical protein Glove_74g148 [Diversispora epigaea]
MYTPFLKTYYRRDAHYLSPEQIEEIRELKDKVPMYKVVGDYHIRKERVLDIWHNCERLQQGGNYEQNPVSLTYNLDMGTQSINHNTYSIETPIITSDRHIKKRKSKSKSARISDSPSIVSEADTINVADAIAPPHHKTKKSLQAYSYEVAIFY